MDQIRRCVRRLVKKHTTRDPFVLAESLDILILYKYLPSNLLGMYLECSCRKAIILNSLRDENTHRITVAHEIGHHMLHPGYNRKFLMVHTLYNKGKLEKEADRFAAELLIPDEYLFTKGDAPLTIEQIAVAESVPVYLVELKNKIL